MSETTVQDPLFIKSEAIKAEYLSSGCQASDVDAAIERLMAECGELFQDDRAAWEFLMEETHEDNEASETVTVRLTLDVTYSLNGENATEMVSRLRKMCERAIGEGMLTGETDAEVEEYSMAAVIQPEPLSEDELADFMLQRIENGDLALEDLPVRLARYGLMEPNAFVDEMRERMQLAKEATSSWAVTLTMENGTKFDWTGEADDQDHAEGQAIAEAVAKTGEQVLEVIGVQRR